MKNRYIYTFPSILCVACFSLLFYNTCLALKLPPTDVEQSESLLPGLQRQDTKRQELKFGEGPKQVKKNVQVEQEEGSVAIPKKLIEKRIIKDGVVKKVKLPDDTGHSSSRNKRQLLDYQDLVTTALEWLGGSSGLFSDDDYSDEEDYEYNDYSEDYDNESEENNSGEDSNNESGKNKTKRSVSRFNADLIRTIRQASEPGFFKRIQKIILSPFYWIRDIAKWLFGRFVKGGTKLLGFDIMYTWFLECLLPSLLKKFFPIFGKFVVPQCAATRAAKEVI